MHARQKQRIAGTNPARFCISAEENEFRNDVIRADVRYLYVQRGNSSLDGMKSPTDEISWGTKAS